MAETTRALERGKMNTEEKECTIVDYHPLTKDEIAELLRTAQASQGDATLLAQIQIRLSQGIRGMTSPHPTDGPVKERNSRLNELYVNRYREGPTTQLVNMLYALMGD